MSTFDIVLLCVIGAFGLFGFWFGLVHTIGSLVGTIAGVFIASRYYEPVAGWLVRTTGWGQNVSRVVIFVIAFFIINRAVGFLFWIVDKILSIFTKLPFIKGINRFLGLIFGILEGAIVLGMIFFFVARFPVGSSFMSGLAASVVAPPLVRLASVLWPLLPDAIRMLQSTVNGLI